MTTRGDKLDIHSPAFMERLLAVRLGLGQRLANEAPELSDKALDRRVQARLRDIVIGWMAEQNGAAVPSETVLGDVHERMMRLELRRQNDGQVVLAPCPDAIRGQGAHYTPPSVVRYMIHHSVGQWLSGQHSVDALRQFRLIDPACGSGVFLIAAAEALVEAYMECAELHRSFQPQDGKPAVPTPALKAAVVQRHIFGVDLDPAALDVARQRLCLWASAVDLDLSTNLRWGNTLVPPDALPPVFDDPAARDRIRPWDPVGGEGFADILANGGFDVVVGNPPYVSGEYIDPVEAEATAQHLDLAQAGQRDRFKLFYERTIRDLLGPNGIHAFIVPDALLARDEHRDLRQWLAQHLTLQRICHVGPVFTRKDDHATGRVEARKPLGVSAVVTIGRRGTTGRSTATAVQIDAWRDGSAAETRTLPLDSLVPADGSSWTIHAPVRWFGPDGMRRTMAKVGATIGTLLTAGPMGITRGEELGKRSLPVIGHGDLHRHRPIIVGSDVQRHRLRPPRHAAPAANISKNPAFYAGPKVLCVKTGASIVAATCLSDDPVLQSVYTLHLSPAARRFMDEDALVGVLCSAWVTAWTWYSWTSGKKLQPQITIGNVRVVPFPAHPDPDTLARIGAAVREIRDRLDRCDGGRAAADPQVAHMEREVDEAVGRLYGLALEDHLDVITPALAALPPSQRPRWFA
jgi:hypothetical protein